jgi:hypothetical protein
MSKRVDWEVETTIESKKSIVAMVANGISEAALPGNIGDKCISFYSWGADGLGSYLNNVRTVR